MTATTIPIPPLRPHLIGRAGQAGFAHLAAKVHPIERHPDISLAVVDNPRRFVVLPRFCTHDTARDLTKEGHVEQDTQLGCYHRRRYWCLLDGKSNSDAPDMEVFAAMLVDGNLVAWLPASVQCQDPMCSLIQSTGVGTVVMNNFDDLDRDSDVAHDVEGGVNEVAEVLIVRSVGCGSVYGSGLNGNTDINSIVGSTGVAESTSLVEERGAC